mgnify:FL=1
MGKPFSYDSIDWTPIGTPVIIRTEDNSRQSGHRSRGEVGLMMGLSDDNLNTRNVLKFNNDNLKVTEGTTIFARKPTLALPMFAALYPRNWPKKETGAMNRIVIKEHGIAYYIKKLKEYILMEEKT